MLQEGDRIPNFSTIDQNENVVSNKDFEGKKTVLFFYPKDNTPGCTAEACNLRDNYTELQKAGYQIFGISPDSAKKHINFIDKFEFPFDLLVDEGHAIAEQFGVWVEKKNYGRTYMGIARTTFLIDENAQISEIISKVKTKDHAAQILKN